jgi:hypothetical protein
MCAEAMEHRVELERFAGQLDGSIDFMAVTYQDLAAFLRGWPEPVPNYHAYLSERYFVA